MTDEDIDRINKLMSIIEKAAGHGSNFKGIRDVAMAELNGINAEIEAERRAPPKGVPAELEAADEVEEDA